MFRKGGWCLYIKKWMGHVMELARFTRVQLEINARSKDLCMMERV